MKFYGRSPVRISLCNGGDTDYYIKLLGWTNLINATLSSGKYICEIEEKKQNFINYRYKNIFLKKEYSRKIYDFENEKDLGLITETIKVLKPDFKGNIKMWTNIPEKSGLGGSSSLVVSLIKALIKLKKMNMLPEDIARLAYKIERQILNIKGGYQDQWAAAFSGGVNYLEFKKENIFLEPLWLSEKLMRILEKNLFLFFIEPRKGDSGNIHLEMEKQILKKRKQDIQTLLNRRTNVMNTKEALLNGDIKKFSQLLNKEHENKLNLVKSLLTPSVKRIYSSAISYGATAGKISGAGSGGCAFFVYEKKDKKNFIRQMGETGCISLPLKLQRLNSMGEL